MPGCTFTVALSPIGCAWPSTAMLAGASTLIWSVANVALAPDGTFVAVVAPVVAGVVVVGSLAGQNATVSAMAATSAAADPATRMRRIGDGSPPPSATRLAVDFSPPVQIGIGAVEPSSAGSGLSAAATFIDGVSLDAGASGTRRPPSPRWASP